MLAIEKLPQVHENRGPDIRIGPSAAVAGKAKSIKARNSPSSYPIPFGNTHWAIKAIHTGCNEIVKRKTCRWALGLGFFDVGWAERSEAHQALTAGSPQK
jgi:hypothetical protein